MNDEEARKKTTKLVDRPSNLLVKAKRIAKKIQSILDESEYQVAALLFTPWDKVEHAAVGALAAETEQNLGEIPLEEPESLWKYFEDVDRSLTDMIASNRIVIQIELVSRLIDELNKLVAQLQTVCQLTLTKTAEMTDSTQGELRLTGIVAIIFWRRYEIEIKN